MSTVTPMAAETVARPSGNRRGSFLVSRTDDGTVTFTITGFSRPVTPLARMTAPLGRAIQDRITTRYLRTLAS